MLSQATATLLPLRSSCNVFYILIRSCLNISAANNEQYYMWKNILSRLKRESANYRMVVLDHHLLISEFVPHTPASTCWSNTISLYTKYIKIYYSSMSIHILYQTTVEILFKRSFIMIPFFIECRMITTTMTYHIFILTSFTTVLHR